MAGMRALGRVYNAVNVASGVAINMTECSGAGFLATNSGTGAATLVFTASKVFGSGYTAMDPTNGFGNATTWYSTTGPTAAWTANASTWNSGTLTVMGSANANAASYVDVLVSELADGYEYVKCTGSNATVVALPYDLTVQRIPPNLKIASSA